MKPALHTTPQTGPHTAPHTGPTGLARPTAGFTLAEVAVTLVIVGIGLLFVLQGLSSSKFTAAHTHNRKVARELALVTLGEIQAGLYREDQDRDQKLFGNYGEQGYEAWEWEVAFGDDSFSVDEDDEGLFFDSFRERERREDEADEDNDEDDEDVREPYEKVRIRVYFPELGDFEKTLTLERWMPWDEVYGPEESDEEDEGEADR